MKQKIYVRDGRRFVEVVDPLLHVGCYVDNLGRFLNHRTVHSIGRCVGIRDGYYIIAWFDRGVTSTYSARLSALRNADWGVNTDSELYKNMYVPEIHELFWAVHEYPELFDKKKDYLSSNSFYYQNSDHSHVHVLYFFSGYQVWFNGSVSYSYRLELKPFSKIKVYGEED